MKKAMAGLTELTSAKVRKVTNFDIYLYMNNST